MPPTFLALKLQLVVFVSAFVMVRTFWTVSCLQFYSVPPRAQKFVKVGHVPPAVWSRGGCRNSQKGGGPFPSLPFPSSFPPSLPSPLEVGPLKPAKGSGGALQAPPAGSGRTENPGRKRIWCTLKLSESHRGNHFEYSEYHVLRALRDKLAMVSP